MKSTITHQAQRYFSQLKPVLLLSCILLSLGARAQTPTYAFNTGSGGANSFPLVFSSPDNDIQYLYLTSDFTPAPPTGTITDVYFRTNSISSSTATYSNLTVKLGATSLTSLTSGSYITGLTTVFTAATYSATVTPGGWLHLTLSTPYSYSNASNLIVELSQSSYTGSFYMDNVSGVGNHRLYNGASAAIADASEEHFGFDVLTSPCTGTPNVGTIRPITPCPNTPFTLTLQNASIAFTGLSYQWQDSNSILGVWTNVGGNTPTLTQTITTPTYYRLKATCANSNLSATTPAYLVNLAPFYFCYCNSASTYIASYSDNIGNVKIIRQHPNSAPVNPGDTLLNNGNATPLTNNTTPFQAYTPYADSANVPVASLYPDSTYRMVITEINSNSFYTGYASSWIDYDHNQAFDATEILGTGTTTSPTQTASFTFTVPHTPQFGITGLRAIFNQNGPTPLNPCGTYNYGETEDYLVNINYSPCNGPALAGTVIGTDTAMCPGYTFSLLDTTYQKQRGNLTYSWQVSNDGGYSYVHVPGSLGKDTLNNILFTNSVKYRFRMICQNTHDTTYSNVWSIALKAPYKCYCFSMATGGSLDTSDLGTLIVGNNVFLSGGGGVNGYSSGAHVLNPQAYRARTNNTDLTPMELYADSTYRLGLYEIIKTAIHADARISVFIDFNRDLMYEAGPGNGRPNDERIYTGVNNSAGFFIDTFITIPDLVVPDLPTGMRVIVNNDLNPNSAANLGCGGYVSGETEDYVVVFRRPMPTGIVGVGNVTGVHIYPNPTGGRFTVKATGSKEIGNVGLTVTDLTGRVLVSKSYDNAGTQFSTDVDISGVAAGVYLVELQAGAQKSVSKLIVR